MFKFVQRMRLLIWNVVWCWRRTYTTYHYRCGRASHPAVVSKSSTGERDVRHAAKKIWMNLSVADKGHQVKKKQKNMNNLFLLFVLFLWNYGWKRWNGCISHSLTHSLCTAVLSISMGWWLIAPVNHCAGLSYPPFIFPDSNLVLALLHTCHCVFFLTLEAGRKRMVINGVMRAHHNSFIMVW